MYGTSISTLPTFQCSICASLHQSMMDYTGHFMTYVIHIFCRFFSSSERKNEMTDRLWYKLSALSKHVKLYDKLRISHKEALFSIEPTAQPLYVILIQPKRWHFCDKIKLLDTVVPQPLSNDPRFTQCIYRYSRVSKRFVEV